MIHISLYEFIEIIIGLSFLWVGVYLLSKNPTNLLTWIVFFFLASMGFVLVTDPIALETSNFVEYVKWQKATAWPFFFVPVLYYHASVLISNKKSKTIKYLIILGYILGAMYYAMEIHGGLILKENVIRWTNYRRLDGFAAGIFMIPSIITACIFAVLGAINFLKEVKQEFLKYFFPALGGIVYLLTGILTIACYCTYLRWADIGFTIGISVGTFLLVFSLIRFHLFSPSEKVFDKNFLYKTFGIVLIIFLYISSFSISKLPMRFESLVLLIIILILVLFTHSFYDWLNTFINDLLYNPTAGFSVVNDEEVGMVLKNYNSLDKLENSSLLRLKSIHNKINHDILPVDVLRNITKEAIEYFKPSEEPHRRTKQNLKYQLLRMIAFDQAEEGQILWELGFEEYPVKIMSQERRLRSPLFETKSPSDYTYTSRNAYLALKKEAIHDITWRISYLEKLAKKKLF